MQKLWFAAAIVALGVIGPAAAKDGVAYDDSWFRAPFWGGEYPDGFTVLKDVTVQLRPVLDPMAEKTIACDLPGGATYQPWNASRVEEQGLTFVSFTKIGDYKLKGDFEATLYRSDDGTQTPISFKQGDTWRYLAYYGEGAFTLEYEGVRYDADNELFEMSMQMGDAGGYEEWLRINCSNNRWGWLFMGDIEIGNGTFDAPNITDYGRSEDLR